MKQTQAALMLAALYALHQDVWFWRDARPLVFGFLPIGLFYQAAFTVATSLVLWALGRRNGFMTPVQMFRDRWQCGHIGTVIFAVQAALLVPYIIIAVMGGGTTLQAVSNGLIPFWAGGAVVSLVVMGYMFLGGMRGTAWVNTFQTVLFLLFGAIAVAVVSAGVGGFAGPAIDLRSGHAVRVCGLRGAHAAPRRGPLLERKHQVGRAGQYALDGRRRARRGRAADHGAGAAAWRRGNHPVRGRRRYHYAGVGRHAGPRPVARGPDDTCFRASDDRRVENDTGGASG